MEVKTKPSHAVYMREYRKRHPSASKRVNLTLDKAEYTRFKELAAEHGLPVAAYVKSLAMVAVTGKPLISKNAEDRLAELIGQMRRIGTNVNQIAHHANAAQKLAFGEALDVKKNLHELEERITAFLKDPAA